MDQLKAFRVTVISAVLMVILVGNSVKGQISTPCTASMMSSFTPCANWITGSTNNGAVRPSSTCCDSLRSLANTSVNCACLLISANVPFQIPFASTLALSLSQACNINVLPSQCKAASSPLPAPGPGPMAASPLSWQGSSEDTAEGRASKFTSRKLTQEQAPAPSPGVKMEAPPTITTPGIRPVFTPPSSSSSSNTTPFMFLSIMLATFVCFLP